MYGLRWEEKDTARKSDGLGTVVPVCVYTQARWPIHACAAWQLMCCNRCWDIASQSFSAWTCACVCEQHKQARSCHPRSHNLTVHVPMNTSWQGMVSKNSDVPTASMLDTGHMT